MGNLLFSAHGRINRGLFWKGFLITFVAWIVLFFAVGMVVPGSARAPNADGGLSFQLNGAAAIPNLLLTAVFTWISVCLGVKRYHDRDKSGWWVLIALIPLIGGIWYFIEVGCLRGTAGPNRFGPNPLSTGSASYAA